MNIEILARKLIPVGIVLLLIGAILLVAVGCSSDNEPSESTTTPDSGSVAADGSADTDAAVTDETDWAFYNERATAFITATANGDYGTAAAMFDDTMTQMFGADGLRGAWADVIALAGEFVAVKSIENAADDGYFISGVISQHEIFGFGWNVVFSEDGLIAGLNSGGTIPLSQLTISDNTAREAMQRDGFTDYPIIVGEGTDFPLDGILSMPDNASADETVPAVVIVHGSGPSDMDGAPAALPNFPNKPFRDIADYLAQNGIAVIRYDKRTFAYGAKMSPDISMREETIEDAILATEMLKTDPRIDKSKVFILGHSMGGMLAPRIHAEGGNFAGLIMLAGSPRNLLQISFDQNIDYVNEHFEGDEKEAALAMLTDEAMDAQVTAILAMSDDEAKNTPTAFGSVYYLKDMLLHPAEDYIRDITQPFLILQGSADFQVTVERDFAVFQELLENRANVTFIVYDGLNHLFMVSTTGTIEEYDIPGHVDSKVLSDIVEWIKEQ